jgi:hypothetical protein
MRPDPDRPEPRPRARGAGAFVRYGVLAGLLLGACTGPTEPGARGQSAAPAQPPAPTEAEPEAEAESTAAAFPVVRYECALVAPWGGSRGPVVRVDLDRAQGWRRPQIATAPMSEPQVPGPHDAPWPETGHPLDEATVGSLRALAAKILERDDWPEQIVRPETELCRLAIEPFAGRPERSWQRAPRGSWPPAPEGDDPIDRMTDALLDLPIPES